MAVKLSEFSCEIKFYDSDPKTFRKGSKNTQKTPHTHKFQFNNNLKLISHISIYTKSVQKPHEKLSLSRSLSDYANRILMIALMTKQEVATQH